MSCSSYTCEKCNPYVFTEERAEALGYDKALLPDLLWGIGPSDLRNVSQDDVFAYEWRCVQDADMSALQLVEEQPHVILGDDVYVGFKLGLLAA